MARLNLPPEDELTADQKAVRDEVVAGVRGKVPAPMIAWMRNAELARRAQHLGELLRYRTSLPTTLSELAILVCARHWTAHMAWTAHKREALKAGITPQVIAAIAARQKPGLVDDKQACVYQLASELLATGNITDQNYARGLTSLGETAMVELVGVIGYYTLACLTLNSFELGLPENRASDLAADDNSGTQPQG